MGNRRAVSMAMLVVRKSKGRKASKGTGRRSGDEGAPGLNPRLGGGGLREPPVVGGVDHILLSLEPSEGGTSRQTNQVVGTSHHASGVRPRVRRVRAVVLTALQKGAVRACRDDRANIALREGSRRAGNPTSKAKQDAERKATSKLRS